MSGKTVLGWMMLFFLTACGSASDNSLTSDATAVSSEKISIPKPTEGSDDPVTVSNTVATPGDMKAGDLMTLSLDTSVNLPFDKVDTDAEFILVVSNVKATSGNFIVQINNNLAEASLQIANTMTAEEFDAAEKESTSDVTEVFHNTLRDREKSLGISQMPAELSLAKSETGFSYAISPGDTETFKILSSIGSATSYDDLEATAECVRDGFVFYLDKQVTESMLSDTDLGIL